MLFYFSSAVTAGDSTGSLPAGVGVTLERGSRLLLGVGLEWSVAAEEAWLPAAAAEACGVLPAGSLPVVRASPTAWPSAGGLSPAGTEPWPGGLQIRKALPPWPKSVASGESQCS